MSSPWYRFSHVISKFLGQHLPYLRLGGHSYRIQPTRYGLVYLGMLVALLIGSINHNNNLGYLLTFFLGSILLISIFHTYRNIRDLVVTGQSCRPFFAGQTGRFPITLKSQASPKFGIILSLDRHFPTFCPVINQAGSTIELACSAQQRGLLKLSKISLATSFPLGLVEFKSHQLLSLSCIVYPRPIASTLPADDEGASSNDLANKPSDGRDFTGLEQYRPGDSPQRIHWKSFAAGKGLFSKVFTDNNTEGTVFSLSALPGRDTEHKLSQLTYMVLTADAAGSKYGLRLGETFLPPNHGIAHKKNCLEALALFPY